MRAGIGFVLFRTKSAAFSALTRDGVQLGERPLRSLSVGECVRVRVRVSSGYQCGSQLQYLNLYIDHESSIGNLLAFGPV